MDEIVVFFASETTVPTEFEYNGELIVNLGKVSFIDKLPNGVV